MKKEDPSKKSKFYINIFPKFDNFIINFKQLEVMNWNVETLSTANDNVEKKCF